MYKVYLALSDTYVSHRKNAIDYMHKNQILNGITVYKDKGVAINKSMLFLDTVVAMSVQKVEEMERLAFHI